MLLGVDLGTSSMKAMLFDEELGRVVGIAREPISIRLTSPDRAEADPEALWTTLVEVLSNLRSSHPAEFAEISAVGLSTIFPALVPMAADGRALHPAILYCDHRSVPQVEDLAESFGRERFETLTANKLTPGTCTLPGILWLRDEEPGIFAKTHVFGQLSTYFVHRLTGEFVVDRTHVSLSGMARAGAEEEWDAEILGHVGLDTARLPRILASSDVAGALCGAAARDCGLPAGIPVVAGGGDAPLAALGGGVFDAGKLFVSAGSTDCIMFSADRPPSNPVFCSIHCALPDLWVANGTMSTAGASVKWFCEQFIRCTPEQMTEWAAEAPSGSKNLLFLPYLQGERTPWWDPSACGAFFGLTLGVDRACACRAVFEGVACGWRQIISLLEKEFETVAPEVLCVGGGSANPLWNRIKATLLGRPVRMLEVPEISSLGACLIAGLGGGSFASVEEARSAVTSWSESVVFEPVPEWADSLENTYGRYLRLYPAMQPLFSGRDAL